MTKPLSPAAQAVLDATDEWASYDIPTGTIAAAALRALANHKTPAWDGTGPACHWTPTPHTRNELRNIADELEGHKSFAATFQTSGGDSDLILRALAEAALAQPEPQELTKQEAQELFNSIRVPIIERLTPGGDGVIVGYEPVQPVDFARAVLARCCGCSTNNDPST